MRPTGWSVGNLDDGHQSIYLDDFEVGATQVVRILNVVEEINKLLPKGLLTCWGEGMVAIPVDAARRLRKAVEGLE